MNKPVLYLVVFLLGTTLGLLVGCPVFLETVDLSLIGNLSTISGINIATIVSIVVLIAIGLRKYAPYPLLCVRQSYRRRYSLYLDPNCRYKRFLYSWSLYRLEKMLARTEIANDQACLFSKNYFTKSENVSIDRSKLSNIYVKSIRPLSLLWGNTAKELRGIIDNNAKTVTQFQDLSLLSIVLNFYDFMIAIGVKIDRDAIILIWQSLIYTIPELAENRNKELISFNKNGIVEIDYADFCELVNILELYLTDIQVEKVSKIIGNTSDYSYLHQLSIIEKEFIFKTEIKKP